MNGRIGYQQFLKVFRLLCPQRGQAFNHFYSHVQTCINGLLVRFKLVFELLVNVCSLFAEHWIGGPSHPWLKVTVFPEINALAQSQVQ